MQEARQRLEDAIEAWVKERGDGGDLVTGWMLLTSVKHPNLPNSDGYTIDHSSGLPYHSQLGLLVGALDDRKNTVLLNTFSEMTGE